MSKPRDKNKLILIFFGQGMLDLLSTIDLNFPHVPNLYEDTAICIFEDPRFLNWWRQEHGVFMLRGKPGSGKSTLPKNMWLTLQKDRLRLSEGPKLTVAFFLMLEEVLMNVMSSTC